MKPQALGRAPDRGRFNLVEVIIALVVIMVVLVGIMGMMPKSVAANTDSLNRNSASDVGDQFLHFMAGRLDLNWTVELQAFPTTKPTFADDRQRVFSDNNLMNRVLPGGGGNELLSTNMLVNFDAPNVAAAWDPANANPSVATNSGLFKVTHLTNAQRDYVGMVRAWRDAAAADARSVRLHAEVSWPADAPYAKRQKAEYQLEVFRSDFVVSSWTGTNDPNCRWTGNMSGAGGLSPSSASSKEFSAILADGTVITKANWDDYRDQPLRITYACFTQKDNKECSGVITVGSQSVNLAKNHQYVLSGDIMVVITADNNGNGQCCLRVVSSSSSSYLEACKDCGDRTP